MDPLVPEQVILKVYLDSSASRCSEVPITPQTTVGDVLDCCKEPGEEQCHLVELWRGCERPVVEEERPYEILQQWGIHRDEVRFFLRHEPPLPAVSNDGRRLRRPGRNGMTRETLQANGMLPHGVDLTLAELQEMAARQQQQIEAQQQLLVAKEQRLRFLKQQELRHEQIAAENERLRKLREKVEAQELKLKKLRALRGQVTEHKGNNNNLTAELEMIKSLFNEKEKELSVAVSKVEQLTKQLEELRSGRRNNGPQTSDNRNNSPAFLELEKLRKELVMRNKLNEAQNSKLAAHREVMQQRKEELSKMDIRIAELQQRLRKSRNQQQQKQQQQQQQIHNRQQQHHHHQQQQQHQQSGLPTQRGGSLNAKIGNGRPVGSNIAAVEPYVKHGSNRDAAVGAGGEQLPSYSINKQDPKYQTLPPNLKLLDGKREAGGEPNGNLLISAAAVADKPSRTDNGHVERNNNNMRGVPELKLDTHPGSGGGGGSGDLHGGPPSPGKVHGGGGMALLPKETIHKVPDYRPSKGHTAAFEAMEETLKKSEKGEGVSLTTRGVYGPTGYKPPSSLSNFTARPFGSTYSTAMLANRPSMVVTHPGQSLTTTTTTSNNSISSPGAVFPKTSTPISSGGAPSSNHQPYSPAPPSDEMKEIFITGAPATSPLPYGRPPQYTTATSGSGLSNTYPQPLSLSINLPAAPADVSPRGRGTAGSAAADSLKPQYQISHSRPQQPMQPQHASDPHSLPPNLPASKPSSLSTVSSTTPAAVRPSSIPPVSTAVNGQRPATGNAAFTSSSSSNFSGATPAVGEVQPPTPGQIALSTSTKVTLSERHAIGTSAESGFMSGGSDVSSSGTVPPPPPLAVGSGSALNSGSHDAEHFSKGPSDHLDTTRPGKPPSPADRAAKKDITASSVSSALSVLMSGPTTAPATSSSSTTTRAFRYAPKSVIANTYMRKLGNNTLEEYRKSMSQIYKDFTPQGLAGGAGGSDRAPTSETSAASVGDGSSTTPENSSSAPFADSTTSSVEAGKGKPTDGYPPGDHTGSPASDEGSTSTMSSQRSGPSAPPPYHGAPPYEIDGERIRYKPNAPRTLRRRLSSGESDDLARFVSKTAASTKAVDGDANSGESGASQPGLAPSSMLSEDAPSSHHSNVVRVDTIQNSYTTASTDFTVGDQQQQQQQQQQPSPPQQQQQQPQPAYDIPHGDGEVFPSNANPVIVVKENKPEVIRRKKTNLKTKGSVRSSRRVSFDPLALLLDASLEGELELVMRTAREVADPSAANDEGITALHNAICAGHYDIVKFLSEFGCNVNAPDSDGWTPLHCAASCNNLAMVRLLVEHGACIFATTISDRETAAEKCEEDEDGYDGCSEYLYSVQEKLGIINNGVVYAVFHYSAQNPDELNFRDGDALSVLRKGDDQEKEWWWARYGDQEGYIPRNLLGLYPRVPLQSHRDENDNKEHES